MAWNLAGTLVSVPLFEWMLVWLLFLAIIYGLLAKTKALSEQVSVNGVIALVGAFIITNYTPVAPLLTQIFYLMALMLAIFLAFVLAIAIIGVEPGKWIPEAKTAGPLYAVIGLVGAVVTSVFGMIRWNLEIDLSAVVTIAIIIIMIMAVAGLSIEKK